MAGDVSLVYPSGSTRYVLYTEAAEAHCGHLSENDKFTFYEFNFPLQCEPGFYTDVRLAGFGMSAYGVGGNPHFVALNLELRALKGCEFFSPPQPELTEVLEIMLQHVDGLDRDDDEAYEHYRRNPRNSRSVS